MSDRSAALQQIIRTWSKEDATSAMIWIQDHSQDPEYSNYLRLALGPLAKQNSNFLKQIIAQQSAQLRPEMSGLALQYLADNNPDAAAAWLAELADQGELVGDAQDLGYKLGNKGVDFVERWQESLPENVAEAAWMSALLQEASNNPAEAAARVSRIEQPNLKAAAVPGVIGSLASVDPRGAADWLIGMNLEYDDERTGFQAMTGWLDAEGVESMHAYALEIEDTKVRDGLLSAMSYAQNIDVERLEEMRGQVSGGLAKIELTATIYDRLKRTDPKKAQTFRIANNLNRNGIVDSLILDECLR